MTPYERGRWLLLLHAYVAGQLQQPPIRFANQRTLRFIDACLWLVYRDATEQDVEDDDEDADADAAAFQRWLLTLWPTPPTA